MTKRVLIGLVALCGVCSVGCTVTELAGVIVAAQSILGPLMQVLGL